jgi:putative transposase
MQKTFKYRLYPKRDQIQRLDTALMLCRRVYNAALAQRIYAYDLGYMVNYRFQQDQLIEVKDHLPEYESVYSHLLQQSVRRIDKAYAAFFRRIADGNKPGFPRFKSQNRFRSLTYDYGGFRIRADGKLFLSKVGEVRMFMHRPIAGLPKICIVKRDNVGDWWASITVDLPDVQAHEPSSSIGVDVGLINIVATSEGDLIKAPKLMKKADQKPRMLQRQLSRKKIGSANRERCRMQLARAERKVERQRDDFLHKLSRDLAGRADEVVFEDLRITSMAGNHNLAGAIMDAGWGKLIQYTSYKAAEAGGKVSRVNSAYTSQSCSRCGALVTKPLSERLHLCPNCGFSSDRDVNAAHCILGRVRRGTADLQKTPVEAMPPSPLSGGRALGQ